MILVLVTLTADQGSQTTNSLLYLNVLGLYIYKYVSIIGYHLKFLHLHEIVVGLYFSRSLSMCLSGSACEQNSSRTDEPIWTWLFAKLLLTTLAWTLLKLVTLCQKSRSQWRNTHFLHNSLLTSLFCISALLCLIKMKFGMSLRYTLGWLVFEFHKNQMDDDVIVT